MRKFLAVLLLLLSTAAFATPLHVVFDEGGELEARYRHWVDVRMSGQKVIIDGLCLSGCTMALGLVPRDHICITPRARLGWHSAWGVNPDGSTSYAVEATTMYWVSHDLDIRARVTATHAWRGETPHPSFMYLEYIQLSDLIRTCSETDLAELPVPPEPDHVPNMEDILDQSGDKK